MLSNSFELLEFLNKRNIEFNNIQVILDEFEKSLKQIDLDVNVIGLNPSVDPILQDQLYKRIISDGVHEWVLHIHNNKNFNSRIKKSNLEKYSYSQLSFYWQFRNICEKLNEIFQAST